MNELIIGIGQSLRRDDGAAAILLQSVEADARRTVRVLPQLLPELVDDLALVDRVLFVDAAVDRTSPTLEPEVAKASPAGFSHFATPEGLLELCRRLHGHSPEAHVLRLPAYDLNFGEGLSAKLQAELPLARNLLAHWLGLPEDPPQATHLPFPLAELERVESYPQTAGPITIKQTHISVVVLLQDVVYKFRKPVRTAFLDFTSPEQRRDDCHREVELNRRLAAEVYLGVVPVVRAASSIAFDPPGGEGDVLEWAVKMRRLPDEATLAQRLRRGPVDPAVLIRLARHIAAFHRQATATREMAAFGRSERVLANALENFAEALAHSEGSLHPEVLQRLRERTETVGRTLASLMDRRAEAGLIRDTHGDLHLEHIYWFPERPVGCEFVIVDCVEFNERFRYADPVADLAFTVMDLGFRGRRDLARIFAREYFEFVEDESGCTLLPFYSAYRAAVRAKVENMQAGESEVPLADRNAARQRATAHWLFALGELSPPPQRPALILFGGLPGSGKSTLAKSLLELPGWDALLIRTDVVRHELHRNAPQLERYGPEMTEQTYTECLKQARETLLAGQRVLVDANFPQESWREQFLALAATLAVPGLFIHCVVADEVARTRLAQRTGDASEADAQIYEQVQARWDPLGQATLAHTIILNTNDPVISLRATLAAKLQNDDLA